MVDLSGKTVLVTGGTRGLGRAIALGFARTGATVVCTYRWGTTPREAVEAPFLEAGLRPPVLVESDVSNADDNRAVMGRIREIGHPLHAVISNVAMGKITHSLDDLKRRSFDLSVGFSAWPVIDLLQAAHSELGAYPRHVIAISSDGVAFCHRGYDLVGACKSLVESFCRYLAVRLKADGVRVNVVRPGALDTLALEETFGAEAKQSVMERVGNVWIDPEGVGRAVVALCSGWMDAVTGQVLVVDEGWSLVSPLDFVHGRDVPFEFPESDP